MKSLVVVMYRMSSGGVERALADFLKEIDPKEYTIDLLLIEEKGDLLQQIPSFVNQIGLELSDINRLLLLSGEIRPSVRYGLQQKQFIQTFEMAGRYFLHKLFRSKLPAYQVALAQMETRQYDVALDFHGYLSATTFYIANKINAKRKYTWVHGEGFIDQMRNYLSMYRKYDNIFCVSRAVCDKVKGVFPEDMHGRIGVLRNYVDTQMIEKRANEDILFPAYACCEKTRLVTVGRLAKEKGYEIAVEAACILKKWGIEFHWFFCGEGSLRKDIEHLIKAWDVEDVITLLGDCKNPYGIMRACDIYIQPSLREGYGLAVVEAALLGCKIITTNIPAAADVIRQGENGIIIEYDALAVASGIAKVINDECISENESSARLVCTQINAETKELVKRVLLGERIAF